MSKCLLMLLVVAFSCQLAAAQSLVSVQDGAVVKVALQQPNLVEASNGKVTAFVFTEGKFTETIDPESGVLYLRPLEAGAHSGFIEIKTDSGHSQRFNLVLAPDENISAQRIVLQYREAETVRPAAAQLHQPLATQHVRQIKKLLREMFKGKAEALLSVKPERMLIGEGLELTKYAALESGAMIGEMLSLRNFSNSTVEVNEAMLHVQDDIVAIVAENQSLAAGAKETIYLVRARYTARL